MTASRYAEKFTSADGSTLVYTFPTAMYELDLGEQPLAVPTSPLTGASYPYYQLASSLAPKQASVASVRFLVRDASSPANIDTAEDELRSELYRIGLGKLWFLDASAARRWCWASIPSMPSYEVSTRSRLSVHQAIRFVKLSDFYGATPYSQAHTIDADPDSITVTNDGNARVYNAVVVLKGAFTDPVITNAANDYRLQSNRDGTTANDWLRFDAGKNRVEYSANGGAAYTGDLANFVRRTGQAHLMVLEPSDNVFSVAGADGATLQVDFSHAYH